LIIFKDAALVLLVLTALTGCETRSKLVAKNVYSHSHTALTLECKDSVQSVEMRQLAKNSSLVLMPIATFLSGGVSVVLAAAMNGGITLDDELNANRIAEHCEMHQYLKTNGDIFGTIAANSAVSAIAGSANILNAPIQPTIE
jgi:hypothetical protein